MKGKESLKILSIINPREINGSRDCDEYGFSLIDDVYLSTPNSSELRINSKMIDVRRQLDECLRLYSSKKEGISEKLLASYCQCNSSNSNNSSEADVIKKGDIVSNEILQLYGISEIASDQY
jgi:hypothetical protein